MPKNCKVWGKSNKGPKLAWDARRVRFTAARCDLCFCYFFLGLDELLGVFRARRGGDGVIVSLVIGEKGGGAIDDLVRHS